MSEFLSCGVFGLRGAELVVKSDGGGSKAVSILHAPQAKQQQVTEAAPC